MSNTDTNNYTTTTSTNGFSFSRDTTLLKVSGALYPWSKRDKTASSNAASADHADADRFNVYVRLIPKEAYLKPQQILAEGRKKIGFPNGIKWDDNGYSAVANTKLDAVKHDLEELQAQFYDAVEALVAELPALEARARADLNGAFDRLGWPTANDVRAKYSFSIHIGVAPDPSDIRCRNVSPEARAEIEKAVKQDQTDKLTDLHKQVVGALEGALSRVVNNLTEFSEGKIKRFEDTLVTNLQELVEALPQLNIAGDRAVDQTIARSRHLLTGLHAALQANTLRDKKTEAGPKVRKEIATEAKDILSKLKAGAVSAKV